MHRSSCHLSSFRLLVVGFAFTASAFATDYLESVSGDISGDRFAPTTLTLTPGGNQISGFFGATPGPFRNDLDYFTVIVPRGTKVTELLLTELVAGGANAFLGVQAGPVMTLAPTSVDPSPLLGWNHTFSNQVGSDLLPALGIFDGLGEGSYTFWSNETDASAQYSYGYNFQLQQLVSAVPEPGTACWGAALVLGAVLRRRRAVGA